MSDLMKLSFQACKEFLQKEAEINLCCEQEKIDFVLNVAIGLLGNLVIEYSGKNIKAMQHNATEVIIALSEWMQDAIDHKKKIRELN